MQVIASRSDCLLTDRKTFLFQGTQFWMTCLAFILVVPITSYLYLPVYMKLRLTSSYEYLNLRFDRHCRSLASGLYMLQMIFYTSVAVYAPALALSHGNFLFLYFHNIYYPTSIIFSSDRDDAD